MELMMGLLGPEQQLTLYQVGGPEQLGRESPASAY